MGVIEDHVVKDEVVKDPVVENKIDEHSPYESAEEKVQESQAIKEKYLSRSVDQNDLKSSRPSTSKREGLRDRSKIQKPNRYALVTISEPRSYQEAITGHNASKWKAAMQEEIEAHEKNKTWFKSTIP